MQVGVGALAPAMSHPARNASSDNILNPIRTFFVTTKTSMGRRILQTERNASLLIDVLRSLVVEHQFNLLDFVIMPDHFHALIMVHNGMTIEKAMQLIKGRFSRRLKLEAGYLGEVWQRGFTEVQVMNNESLKKHQQYISENPVIATLAEASDQYPFCYEFLALKKAKTVNLARAKAHAS
jgi:putative transposase